MRTRSVLVVVAGLALASLACNSRRERVAEPTTPPSAGVTPAPFVLTEVVQVEPAGAADAPAEVPPSGPTVAPTEAPAQAAAPAPTEATEAEVAPAGGDDDALGDELEGMLDLLAGMNANGDGLEDVPEFDN